MRRQKVSKHCSINCRVAMSNTMWYMHLNDKLNCAETPPSGISAVRSMPVAYYRSPLCPPSLPVLLVSKLRTPSSLINALKRHSNTTCSSHLKAWLFHDVTNVNKTHDYEMPLQNITQWLMRQYCGQCSDQNWNYHSLLWFFFFIKIAIIVQLQWEKNGRKTL